MSAIPRFARSFLNWTIAGRGSGSGGSVHSGAAAMRRRSSRRIQEAAARHVLDVGTVEEPIPPVLDRHARYRRQASPSSATEPAAAAPARGGSRFRARARSRSGRPRTARFARTVRRQGPSAPAAPGKLRADLAGDVRQVDPRCRLAACACRSRAEPLDDRHREDSRQEKHAPAREPSPALTVV